MSIAASATFQHAPTPTTFVVNVIHVHPGKQDEAFRIIQEIVSYASCKEGFLWSSIAKSVDGLTVVNVEAISSENDIDRFFADADFSNKFSKLKSISDFEYHIYNVGTLVFSDATTDAPLPSSEGVAQ